MVAPILTVTNLTKRFPAARGIFGGTKAWFNAVDDVTLHHSRGATLGIVGESGCGKTTLGKCIAGLVPPSAGTVVYDGVELSNSSKVDLSTRLRVQMVHQATGSALDPRMRVRHLIAEGLHQLPGMTRRRLEERVREAMHAVGLRTADADRYPHMFSGGQRQRIVIARAIVLRPSLLVLDEPTSALDVSIQVKILNLLKDLQQELNLTYILISHDMRAIEAMADSIVVMYLGRVVEWGPAEQVLHHPVHPYTVRLIAAVPVADLSHRIGGKVAAATVPPDSPQLDVGCSYRPRCPLAEDECSLRRPALTQVGPHHSAACPPSARLLGQTRTIINPRQA